jgi:hypothetical protein
MNPKISGAVAVRASFAAENGLRYIHQLCARHAFLHNIFA